MATNVLPFPYDGQPSGCDHGPNCPLRGRLPPELQEACDRSPFLAELLLPMRYWIWMVAVRTRSV